jgi:arylsulfatase A-like enzyme
VGEQNYYGEITAIDRSVGRLRSTLQELGVAADTLLWYTSDNGGAAGPNSTGNLRGGKGTLWEGGVRVPGLVEWPARITKPLVSAVPCSTLDIYPTVLAATKTEAEKQTQPLDGMNLLPLFDQPTIPRSKPIPFCGDIRNENAHTTLLDWPYKLHLNAQDRKGKKKGGVVAPVLLYDVSQDPKENSDLAGQQPERVQQMTTVLQTWKTSVRESLAGKDY